MRRTITTTLLLTAALPLLLTACNEVSPYNEACTALCEELVVDCELPGYQDSSCVPNCEAELGDGWKCIRPPTAEEGDVGECESR